MNTPATPDWKDSYKGKLWSTAVQKCFEAPFVEVAIQHLLQKIDEKHQLELTQSRLQYQQELVETMEKELPDLSEFKGTDRNLRFWQGFRKGVENCVALLKD